MGKNLVIRHVDSLIVLLENTLPPEDVQWDAFLAILEQTWPRFHSMKVFVRTPGGGPTPSQQIRLRGVLRNKPILVAVVSESITVRFLVSSIALLNRDIKSFAIDEQVRAYEHLKLSNWDRAIVERLIEEMASEVA